MYLPSEFRSNPFTRESPFITKKLPGTDFTGRRSKRNHNPFQSYEDRVCISRSIASHGKDMQSRLLNDCSDSTLFTIQQNHKKMVEIDEKRQWKNEAYQQEVQKLQCFGVEALRYSSYSTTELSSNGFERHRSHNPQSHQNQRVCHRFNELGAGKASINYGNKPGCSENLPQIPSPNTRSINSGGSRQRRVSNITNKHYQNHQQYGNTNCLKHEYNQSSNNNDRRRNSNASLSRGRESSVGHDNINTHPQQPNSQALRRNSEQSMGNSSKGINKDEGSSDLLSSNLCRFQQQSRNVRKGFNPYESYNSSSGDRFRPSNPVAFSSDSELYATDRGMEKFAERSGNDGQPKSIEYLGKRYHFIELGDA